jgi:hypothetical protein
VESTLPDMNLWARIKRLWTPQATPDHPLTERERRQRPPDTVYGELANTATGFVSHGDLDGRRTPHR